MTAKTFLIFCVLIFMNQSAFSKCIGPVISSGLAPATLAYDGIGAGCPQFTPAASSGGSFVVTSASPIAPTGITILSENNYEGLLVVDGSLPMLGSVGVEGEISTAGAGAVSYGCGDDSTAIVAEEGAIATGIVTPIIAPEYAVYGIPFGYGLGYGIGYGPSVFGLGYGAGCSCGAFY